MNSPRIYFLSISMIMRFSHAIESIVFLVLHELKRLHGRSIRLTIRPGLMQMISTILISVDVLRINGVSLGHIESASSPSSAKSCSSLEISENNT